MSRDGAHTQPKRTLGEMWGDERWGPPGIRRHQPQPPKPAHPEWDGFCLTGDPVAPPRVPADPEVLWPWPTGPEMDDNA